MKKDFRPYIVKKIYIKFQKFYVNHFLKPQFNYLGKSPNFMKPWNVELFGTPINIGDFATVIATPDKKIRLSVWSWEKKLSGIKIGNYCLICPGVRITSALEIIIKDSCMIASNAYITDSDWHDIYDRSQSIGKTSPVVLNENVWIGDSAIICKGVTIGKNSIIGAGAVVTNDIPENVIAAGNPAKIVKRLNTDKPITTRKDWLKNPAKLSYEFDKIDKDMLKNNTFRKWFKYILFPGKE